MKHRRLLASFLTLVLCSVISISASASDNMVLGELDADEQILFELADDSGLHRNQVVLLRQQGYTDDVISKLSLAEADAILTENMDYEELSMYYTHIAPRPFDEYKDFFPEDFFVTQTDLATLSPYALNAYCSLCGYTPSSAVNWTHCSSSMTGFNADGCFHEDSGTTNSNINTLCYHAKMLAMKIFKQTSSASLNYDYYMFGENYGATHSDWAHEGIDMQYYAGASVYAPISGVVVYSSSSKGQVNIYNENLGITMNFQHLSGVAGTTTLKEGQTVAQGQFLGYQNSSDNHVHVQVCDGSCEVNGDGICEHVHSGQDTQLLCDAPYGYY